MIEHGNSVGNPGSARDHRAAKLGDAADNLPGMLCGEEEKNRPLPLGDVQAGRDRLVLLALRMEGGRLV